MSKTTDLAIAYRVLKTLTTDWDDQPAYHHGIIDRHGNEIKKPTTDSEKDSYTFLDKLLFRLKRLLDKVPAFHSKFTSIAAAIALLKEGVEDEKLFFELLSQASTLVSENDIEELKEMMDTESYISYLLEDDGGAAPVATQSADSMTKTDAIEGYPTILNRMVRRKKKPLNNPVQP